MPTLTVQEIEALKPADRPYKRNADTGLQIRVGTNGGKTWVVQYMIDGKQREYRLPRHYGKTTDDAHLSLKDARSEADRIRALARAGIDYQVKLVQDREAEERRLAAERAAAEAQRLLAQSESLTVTDLFTAWVSDGVRRKDGNAELRRLFNKDVLPAIGHLRVKDVTEHDIRALLRTMVGRGVNRLAVTTRVNLAQMFRWAERRQPWRRLLTEGNPMDLVEIAKIVNPDYDLRNQRERILSSEEIAELYRIFIDMRAQYDQAEDRRTATRPVERTTELAIWIMLATLCRVGELSKARWENVNLEFGQWLVPGEDTKGSVGRQSDLMVYLSPFALRQFRQLHALTGHTDWCFPASNKPGHLCVKSISKQVGDRQTRFKKDADGERRAPLKNRSRDEDALVLSDGRNGNWTPHDLRRTGATIMQALGVPLETIDRCQNHVLAGSKVRRHYLHYDYADEKRKAWRLLGERLEWLTQKAGKNILSFGRARHVGRLDRKHVRTE